MNGVQNPDDPNCIAPSPYEVQGCW